MIWAVTLAGVALGGLFGYADFREAAGEKRAVAAAFARIGPRPAGTTVWNTGIWGFQFDAGQAGARLFAPDPMTTGSPAWPTLHAGDWLLLPAPPIPSQPVALNDRIARRVGTVQITDELPLTVLGLYSGRIPIDHHSGPRVRVTLVRITQDTPMGPLMPTGPGVRSP